MHDKKPLASVREHPHSRHRNMLVLCSGYWREVYWGCGGCVGMPSEGTKRLLPEFRLYLSRSFLYSVGSSRSKRLRSIFQLSCHSQVAMPSMPLYPPITSC